MFKIVRGAIRFFSERYGGRPFVDCLPCSLMVVLRFMGMYVNDGDQKVIRAAMPGHPTGATTIAMNWAALKTLGCPTLPAYGGVDPSFILANLKLFGQTKDHKMVFQIIIQNRDLPMDSQTRKITGVHYDGLHAIALVAKNDDGSQVYVINPMGRDAAHPPMPTPPDWKPYEGNWEPVENLWKAASQTDTGRIKAAYGTYNQAKQI